MDRLGLEEDQKRARGRYLDKTWIHTSFLHDLPPQELPCFLLLSHLMATGEQWQSLCPPEDPQGVPKFLMAEPSKGQGSPSAASSYRSAQSQCWSLVSLGLNTHFNFCKRKGSQGWRPCSHSNDHEARS